MVTELQALQDAYCRHKRHPDPAAQLTAQAYAQTILDRGEALPTCGDDWVDLTLQGATKEQLGIIPTLPDYNPITGMGYKQNVGFKWPWQHDTVEDLQEELGLEEVPGVKGEYLKSTLKTNGEINIDWLKVGAGLAAGTALFVVYKLT